MIFNLHDWLKEITEIFKQYGVIVSDVSIDMSHNVLFTIGQKYPTSFPSSIAGTITVLTIDTQIIDHVDLYLLLEKYDIVITGLHTEITTLHDLHRHTKISFEQTIPQWEWIEA